MKHRFKVVCYNAQALLGQVNDLKGFQRNLERQAQEDHAMSWTPDEYKGMAFEALVEVLITASPIDKRINICNYRPHDARIDGKDMGIDGYGQSHNGNAHTVQIKYRNDPTATLTTKDSISNFVAKTISHPDFRDADMTVFTTAKDLHQGIAEDMYHGRVRTLGKKDLSKLVDGNFAFWNLFRQEMGI